MNKETMQLIALAISESLGLDGIYPAEWLDKEERKNPDAVQLGSHNDWWLRTDIDGSLFVKARYYAKDYFTDPKCEWAHEARCMMALRALECAKYIKSITGVEVSFPWKMEDVLSNIPRFYPKKFTVTLPKRK